MEQRNILTEKVHRVRRTDGIPALTLRLPPTWLPHAPGCNLTLVNEKLNPALSNSKWSKKKPALVKHSVLHLKDDVVEAVDWDEDSIFKRSERLAEIVCEIWPRPEDPS